jgi:hypothetical protein
MNKTTAIIITVVTVLCCGCPGLGAICLGGLSAMGSQMPEVLAQSNATAENAILGGLFYICGGLFMLVIPVVAGIVSFRMVKPEETIVPGEPIPPAQ